MNQVIDSVFTYVLAFFCFFITYGFFHTSEVTDDNKKTLKEKIDALITQHDKLLEATSTRDSTFAKIEQEYGVSAETKHGLVDKIALIMKKAGITDISTYSFIILCLIGGVILASIITYFNFLNKVIGSIVGMCVGAYLMYTFLASRAAKKRMQFLQLFPDAIDMMIRGVKAGLTVGRIMKLVSMESKEPISSEFRTISQKLDLGVKPENVLVDAAEKIDLEEFRFLTVALVLQMENGGGLAEILQNLSGIVRKRLELGLKLKAMSAEARMSAIVISALPFVFAGIMALVNPNHLKEFITPGSGQTLLKVGITLFSIGTFIMLKASKIKV
ncbi:MAG: type II secretion system F family protein [Holosporaceae bacterium]|jgi:tight adherence protein B|nr:type II secretion system F family protein [Holosporaceae bacterium]